MILLLSHWSKQKRVEHYFLKLTPAAQQSPHESLSCWPIKSGLLKSKHLLPVYSNFYLKTGLSKTTSALTTLNMCFQKKRTLCLNCTMISNSRFPQYFKKKKKEKRKRFFVPVLILPVPPWLCIHLSREQRALNLEEKWHQTCRRRILSWAWFYLESDTKV